MTTTIGSKENEGLLGVPGLELRDWFAGQMLTGILAGRTRPIIDDSEEIVAETCYRYADAMLAERAK